jgi:hypothetical protein
LRNLIGTSTAGKYMFTIGAVSDWLVENIRLNTASDGVNHSGPAIRGRITNISGTTGDDMVSFGGQQYMSHLDTAGDYQDVVADGLYPNGALEALRFQGGFRITLKNLTVRNVQGTVQQHGVLLSDDGTYPNDIGTVANNIVIENIGVESKSASGGYAAVECTWATINSMTVRTVKVTDTGTVGVSLRVGVYTAVLLDDLVTTVPTSQPLVYVRPGASVTDLQVTGLRFAGKTSARAINLTGPVAGLSLGAPYMNTGGTLVYAGAPLASCKVFGASLFGLTSGALVLAAGAAGATTAAFYGVMQDNGAALVSVQDTNASCTLLGSGNTRPSMATAAISRTGTQTMRVNGADMTADVSKLAPAKGDSCYNINGSLGTGTGPVIYTGTAWKSFITGATA